MPFSTPAVSTPPTASTHAASAVTATGATLNGTVNPDTQATTYHFEYGTTTAYGSQTPDVNAGSDQSDHAVSAVVSGLAPATTYHYRLVATNASGTVRGPDQVFTTPAAAGNGGGNGGGNQGGNGGGSQGGNGGSGKKATPPSCSLRLNGSAVLLKKTKKAKGKGKGKGKGKSKKSKTNPGTLTLTVTCNQDGSVTVAGTLTEAGKKPKHGKAHPTKFNLGPASANVRAGAPTTLTLSLPGATLTGLAKHVAESAAFTLTVSNANGTGHATAGPAHLTGV